jgi:hypothetical protein
MIRGSNSSLSTRFSQRHRILGVFEVECMPVGRCTAYPTSVVTVAASMVVCTAAYKSTSVAGVVIDTIRA